MIATSQIQWKTLIYTSHKLNKLQVGETQRDSHPATSLLTYSKKRQ